MDRVLTGNIWQSISNKVRKEKRRHAALAYISTDEYVRFGKGDILVCDASDQAISTGETSAAVLQEFFKKGALLYSCRNLHAKVLVFGKNVLIGSCNLSISSATTLREVALLSSRSSIRSQAAAFIHMIKEESEPVDQVFLERIRKIKVIRRGPANPPRRPRTPIFGNRTWVIRTYEINPESYKDEEKWVEKAEKEVKRQLSEPESEVGWIRWTGRGHFRELAKRGDTVIDMRSAERGKRVIVSAPTPILKRQDHGKWSRFYYEIPQEKQEMSWTEFQRNLTRLGIKSIKKNSAKELSRRDATLIDTIWEEQD